MAEAGLCISILTIKVGLQQQQQQPGWPTVARLRWLHRINAGDVAVWHLCTLWGRCSRPHRTGQAGIPRPLLSTQLVRTGLQQQESLRVRTRGLRLHQWEAAALMAGGGRERLRLFTDNSRPEPEPGPLPAVSTKQSGNIIQQRWKMRRSRRRHACIFVLPELGATAERQV